MLRPQGIPWHPRDFQKFWISQSLSLLSIQFGNLAFPLTAIVLLDASAAQTGLLAGIGSTPWLVFGLFAGIGVDRFRRRPILIAAHIGRACLTGSIPVAALLNVLTMEQLYVVAFGGGTLSLCFETAYHSYLPSLVSRKHLAEGNSKLATTSAITRMIGPGLAGAVVQWLSVLVGIGINALAYLISGLLMWRIRRAEPPIAVQTQPSIIADLRRGLLFSFGQPVVRTFMLSEATYMFFFSMMQAVLLVFFTRNLNLAPGLVGVIFTAGSVGGLVGGIISRRVGERFNLGPTVIGGSFLRAIGLAIVPAAMLLGPFAVPALIISRMINALGWTVWQVHQETTQQLLTPNELRGRVTGSSLFVVRSAGALGAFAAASLAARVGPVTTMVIGGLCAMLGTIWLLSSSLVRLRAESILPADNAEAPDDVVAVGRR